jgi:hypothetical protein
MPLSFDVEKWLQLSPDEQSQRCHQMASVARHLAQEVGPHREAYVALARTWEDLAVAIERDSI